MAKYKLLGPHRDRAKNLALRAGDTIELTGEQAKSTLFFNKVELVLDFSKVKESADKLAKLKSDNAELKAANAKLAAEKAEAGTKDGKPADGKPADDEKKGKKS